MKKSTKLSEINKYVNKSKASPCTWLGRHNSVKMSDLPDFDLHIQQNASQNPSKLFWGYQQIDFKVYMKRQKTKN